MVSPQAADATRSPPEQIRDHADKDKTTTEKWTSLHLRMITMLRAVKRVANTADKYPIRS